MDGETKQLIRFGDEDLVTRAVRTAQQSMVGDVFLILGYMADQIQEILTHSLASDGERPFVSIVHNSDFNEGIASSIRAAINIVDDYDAVIFMTIDQPFVNARWLELIKNSFVENNREVVASNYGEPLTPGIPALFARSKFPALAALKGDRGAKQIILESDSLLLDSTVANFDIDTKADLQECLKFELTLRKPIVREEV